MHNTKRQREVVYYKYMLLILFFQDPSNSEKNTSHNPEYTHTNIHHILTETRKRE